MRNLPALNLYDDSQNHNRAFPNVDAYAITKASMPGLVRKILIFAAIDGLVLQPLAQRGQRPAPASKIAYKDKSIAPIVQDGIETDAAGRSFEAFGIVGLFLQSHGRHYGC